MRAKSVQLLLSGFFLLAAVICSRSAFACGHNGVYLGAGYNQTFMYTSADRLSAGNLGRVIFSPGFGANLSVGYDFCGSRWGIQMPFEYSRLKLNHSEWVNQFGSTLEGILHLAEWENGFGIHLVGGVGWSYLSEGSIADFTAASGISANFGPGLTYIFHSSDKTTAALAFEVPVRYIRYFGNHLSRNGTSVLSIPLRLSIQVGF